MSHAVLLIHLSTSFVVVWTTPCDSFCWKAFLVIIHPAFLEHVLDWGRLTKYFVGLSLKKRSLMQKNLAWSCQCPVLILLADPCRRRSPSSEHTRIHACQSTAYTRPLSTSRPISGCPRLFRSTCSLPRYGAISPPTLPSREISFTSHTRVGVLLYPCFRSSCYCIDICGCGFSTWLPSRSKGC
ncbi:uncharacterized protein EV420DRAFT_335596 [Desarmillaria tabescens]|uniref:Secreted protein n=1 Tax=Armillaria tabescens TaxID=1929756 RepID=A0AA39KF72_ARMTA|nr:uncharacterized protein EV420DRAFT_335596 [Desarmillaria tabescens]KAK0458850.1 hypothetical protein EV420DRAFT_335596 [Desarmillaria tabescens]